MVSARTLQLCLARSGNASQATFGWALRCATSQPRLLSHGIRYRPAPGKPDEVRCLGNIRHALHS